LLIINAAGYFVFFASHVNALGASASIVVFTHQTGRINAQNLKLQAVPFVDKADFLCLNSLKYPNAKDSRSYAFDILAESDTF
jgi:hypothetical protein